MAMYSSSDLRRGGALDAIKIILAFPLRRDLRHCLYPKIALPDFMTSLIRLFIESCCFCCNFQIVKYNQLGTRTQRKNYPTVNGYGAKKIPCPLLPLRCAMTMPTTVVPFSDEEKGAQLVCDAACQLFVAWNLGIFSKESLMGPDVYQ
mmetsp:Transcript_22056/g.51945  ORF Transcript_22056/g.51945 Transcript_22056/m.51945 type:complete len:148 (+) Transcript_22056:210-653(+)